MLHKLIKLKINDNINKLRISQSKWRWAWFIDLVASFFLAVTGLESHETVLVLQNLGGLLG